MTLDSLQIKSLRALDDLQAVVELQKTYWGDNSESVIPAHMLFSLANHGGHVLTAYVDNQPVGVLVGFLGTNNEDQDRGRPAMANLQIVSKRMVVLPSYREHGIGFRLKKRQRDLAIRMGVRLIVWTFDPLLSMNAHLNIRRLGAICTGYRENYYGTSSESGLARGGASDRLLVEWWVTGRRVEERLYGQRGDLTLAQYLEAETPIINPTRSTADGLAIPSDGAIEPRGTLALVEIPPDYPAIESSNSELAHAWRLHIREHLKRLFSLGYVITDFIRESHEGRVRSFYLLSYSGPQFETVQMN